MRRLLALSSAVLLLAACDRKQEPAALPPPAMPSSAAPLPEGHPPTDQLPANHPDVTGGAAMQGGMPSGHPPVAQPVDTKELLKQVEAMKEKLKDKPKSFEISVALGNLYYDNALYLDAIDHFRQAAEKAKEPLALWDSLDAKVKGAKLPDPASVGCDPKAKQDLEAVYQKAKALDAEGKAPAARACLATELPAMMSVLTRRASSFFLIGNPDKAIAEHEAALSHDPNAPENLFFVGALLFDGHGDELEQLQKAKAAWKRFLEVAPKDNNRREIVEEMLPKLEQAIAAGGVSKLEKPAVAQAPQGGPDAPPPLSPETMAAAQNMPRTPEMDQTVEKTLAEGEALLAKNDGNGAAMAYRGVMPYAPNNPRLQAGMAAAQILKGSGMAERVFGVAAANNPQAVDALAQKLKDGGNGALAQTLWKKLADAAPEYAQKAGLDKKLSP